MRVNKPIDFRNIGSAYFDSILLHIDSNSSEHNAGKLLTSFYYRHLERFEVIK